MDMRRVRGTVQGFVAVALALSWAASAGGVRSVLASRDISDLGKPTADVPGSMYDPLANFGRIARGKPTKGRVKVVLFDTAWDNASADGRWPIVKALNQFGSWSGLAKGAATVPSRPDQRYADGRIYPGVGPLPTYDLTHARYTSRYVALTHRTLQLRKGGPHLRQTPRDSALLNRVLRLPAVSSIQCFNLCAGYETALPVVVVGRYGMHGVVAEPLPHTAGQVVSFDSVQQALQGGDAPVDYWIKEFNTYVNIVTAFVCHENGGKPTSVCMRQPIRYLLSAIQRRIK